MTLYEDLKWRGLIQDISDEELINKLNNEKLTFYIGTDPTADSMHIGHYSSFLISKRLAKYGHKPILLVGGATGLIGDPKPTAERPMISKEEVEHNFKGLKEQAERIFGFEVVNNYDWTKDINVIDFLRDYGKYYQTFIVIANNSMYAIEFEPEYITAMLNTYKNEEWELIVYSADDYMRKVRRRQNWDMALYAFSESLAAADAGYSTSTTTSAYSGASNSSANASVFGSDGYAIGNYSGNSAYYGTSSSTTTSLLFTYVTFSYSASSVLS